MLTWLRSVGLVLLLSGLAFCAGCGKPADAFQATDVTGADFGKEFKLTDHAGKMRSLSDFKGKAVVVFFGYLHCPDFCPGTLSQLAKVLDSLGEDGKRVQVLFVTVDPERDKLPLMAGYVTSFNASFLGMGATDAEVGAIAKDFHVLYESVNGPSPGQYTMNHSTGTFVFDTAGRLRLYFSYGTFPEVMKHDLALLLKAP